MSRHDVVVIGGGAGGLTAAREANRRGARTLLVSEGPLGGECTHTGCVPSKALLDAASRGRSFTEAMATVRRRDVRNGVRVERVERNGTGDLCLHLADGTTVTADRLLVAAGRTPTTAGLGLADAGIEVDADGFIRSARPGSIPDPSRGSRSPRPRWPAWA